MKYMRFILVALIVAPAVLVSWHLVEKEIAISKDFLSIYAIRLSVEHGAFHRNSLRGYGCADITDNKLKIYECDGMETAVPMEFNLNIECNIREDVSGEFFAEFNRTSNNEYPDVVFVDMYSSGERVGSCGNQPLLWVDASN